MINKTGELNCNISGSIIQPTIKLLSTLNTQSIMVLRLSFTTQNAFWQFKKLTNYLTNQILPSLTDVGYTDRVQTDSISLMCFADVRFV